MAPAGLGISTLVYACSWGLRHNRFWLIWLVSGVSVALGGVALLRARWHGLQRIRDLERQHELDLERGRIAQDMHDSLGADLTRLALRAEMACGQAEIGSARQQIREVAEMARGLVESINELVWATDPRHNTVDELAAYLRAYTSELLEPTNLNVQFEVPEALPSYPISGVLRRHLFLATKEALNNAIKHAGATQVTLALSVSGANLEIVITDDGRGFSVPPSPPHAFPPDPPPLPCPGRGLRNLRERLAATGGSVEMDSAPGCGTRIRLAAPLAGRPSAINGRQRRKSAAVHQRPASPVRNP